MNPVSPSEKDDDIMSTSFKDTFSRNTGILKAKASKASMHGVLVAAGAVVIATLLVAYSDARIISLDGIVAAQRTNLVLWILDALPFIFAYIGQYGSYMLANEASLMVMEQTEELRQHAGKLEAEAAFSATHDALTGLPNRALFYDRVERALRDPRQQPAGAAVLLLVIENLKEIQGTLGLESSDILLKQYAARLTSWSSAEDSVARIDANSFAILMCETGDRTKIEASVHKLIKALEPHFAVNMLKLTLQSSVGIVIFPEHGDDPDTLLQRAGVAGYFASKSVSGYNFYTSSMDEKSPRRLTLVSELKRALERNELELYFQPKVQISDRSVPGVEALVRWKHELYGFIPPEEFIDLAERTRTIRPLTDWVLENAFQACASWHQIGMPLTVSINLSSKDLHDPELPDHIAGVAAKTGISPEWVIFEITETSIMSDPARVLVIVERLRSMGYQFSIDDFGTGYSSLAYLKRLPVSELKIDKSFVSDMLANENDAIIVRATVDLAHNLGLKVTAEGIEDQEALAILTRMGCDLAQGYIFSKPLPRVELDHWLADWNRSGALTAS